MARRAVRRAGPAAGGPAARRARGRSGRCAVSTVARSSPSSRPLGISAERRRSPPDTGRAPRGRRRCGSVLGPAPRDPASRGARTPVAAHERLRVGRRRLAEPLAADVADRHLQRADRQPQQQAVERRTAKNSRSMVVGAGEARPGDSATSSTSSRIRSPTGRSGVSAGGTTSGIVDGARAATRPVPAGRAQPELVRDRRSCLRQAWSRSPRRDPPPTSSESATTARAARPGGGGRRGDGRDAAPAGRAARRSSAPATVPRASAAAPPALDAAASSGAGSAASSGGSSRPAPSAPSAVAGSRP